MPPWCYFPHLHLSIPTLKTLPLLNWPFLYFCSILLPGPLPFLLLLQLGDTCLILTTHLLNPSVHTFWMPLPDSLQIQSLTETSILSIPSYPTPYSHTEATLTIPITFCLLLSNISALFPSEEQPASQPAPPDQPSVISTDFLPFFTISHTHPQEASKVHADVLGGTL